VRGGRKLSVASLADAKAEIAANTAADATLICRDSEVYPAHLAQFDDAPVILSTRGNLHLLQQPIIALSDRARKIGTRTQNAKLA